MYFLIGLVVWTLLGWWLSRYMGWLYYTGETNTSPSKLRNLQLAVMFWGCLILSIPYFILTNIYYRLFKE